MNPVERSERESADAQGWLILIVLTIAFVCSTLDRIVISLLVEPITSDLQISDTQFSLLQGLAFLLVYSVSGVGVGLLVDRVNRTRLIAAGISLWSLMTALCGLARNFTEIFFARAGVGIGEATLSPAAFSLIADSFPPRRHAFALGVYSTGGATGACLALMLGGQLIVYLENIGPAHIIFLGQLAPWQLTFLILSIPGLLIALIVLLIREPERVTGKADNAEGLFFGNKALRSFYARNKFLLLKHHLAVGACNLGLLGALSWLTALFIRVHGWDVGKIGVTAGLSYLVGGTAGFIGGGAFADYLMRFGAQSRLILCAGATFLGCICGFLYPLLSSPNLSMVFFGGFMMFASLPLGAANAALQLIVPGNIRGVVSSLYFVVLSMVAILGPTLIAITADTFFPYLTGIRFATSIVLSLTLACSTVLFLVCTPAYKRLMELEPGVEVNKGLAGET